MEHHPKFEHSRFVGDKRTQFVYDLDAWDDEDIINEIVDQGVGLCFGPDTLAEARKPWLHVGDTRRSSAPSQAPSLTGHRRVA